MANRLSSPSLWALTAAAAALSLTACAGTEDTPRIDPPENAQAPQSADTGSDDAQQGSELQSPNSEADQAAQEQALAVLEAFLADTDDYDEWWSELSPLLSPGGTDMYDSVDPVNIPQTEPTGATGVIASQELEAVISVETDLGDFQVTVVRPSAESNWAGEHIQPPEEPATGGDDG